MTVARLLLDTHTALWWWRDVDRLSTQARAVIENGEDVLVSAITAYEIGQKWRIGKLPMLDDPVVNLPRLMASNKFGSLPISDAHSLRAALLSGKHRDPFDRLIAAQALEERLIVVTRDPAFAAFGCKVLW